MNKGDKDANLIVKNMKIQCFIFILLIWIFWKRLIIRYVAFLLLKHIVFMYIREGVEGGKAKGMNL